MTKLKSLGLATALLAVFAAACESSGAGGRKVEITQKDDGCTPASVSVTPGEKLNLVVKNESSSDAYEVEGIEGTNLEEVVVHEGKTLSVGFAVPSGSATHKLKCYVPAGTSTIIELVAGGGGAAASPGASSSEASPASGDGADAGGAVDASVAVTLVEYSVTPDKASVSAGKIRFVATNASKQYVHELAVLKTKDGGGFENMGEIEDIDPGRDGSVVLDLKPGAYQLACVVAKGEFGSTVDHYQQGMHTEFSVE